MSTNFVQEGKQFEFTAAANLTSGQLVNIGSGVFGVVENTVASAAKGIANLEGVFSVAKDSSTFATVGATASMYVNDTTLYLTTTSSGATAITNVMIWEAAATGDSVVKVKLTK